MIVKHVPMHVAAKSDFADLVKYLEDTQQKAERVGAVRMTNCQGLNSADVMREVLNTQAQNTRAAGDKTYHLMVSFRVGETPETAVMHAIEDRLCDALGFGAHQRISVVHHDTDNLHFHVAINKIHPKRLTIHDPFNAYHTLARTCAALEREFHLEADNHTPVRSRGENRARDMEQHAGVESLLGWVQRECAPALEGAATWQTLHATLRQYGLVLAVRGNGFVIQDASGLAVKASSVSRALGRGRLEARLGAFEPPAGENLTDLAVALVPRPGVSPCPPVGLAPPPAHCGRARALVDALILRIDPTRRYAPRPLPSYFDTSDLFRAYQVARQRNEHGRQFALAEIQARRNVATTRVKQAAAARQSMLLSLPRRSPTRRALAAETRRGLRDALAAIARQAALQSADAQVRYPRQSWADWLRTEAEQGNPSALFALRARPGAGLAGNTLTGAGASAFKGGVVDPGRRERVTKKGTLLYRVGELSIRDDGDRLSVSRGASASGLQVALRLACARFGHHLQVNGSDAFQEAALHAAVCGELKLTFANPELERRRAALAGAIQPNQPQEKPDGQDPFHTDQRNPGANRSRRGASPSGYAGRFGRTFARSSPPPLNDGRGGRAGKPDIGQPGCQPPPQSQHRLRGLSSLGVVRFAQRSEVLLQGDVPDRLVQHRPEPVAGLRRTIHSIKPSSTDQAMAVVDQYIVEQTKKSALGRDIPKVSRYDFSEGAVLTFAGLRTVEGQTLLLLQTTRGIEVMPASPEMVRRLGRRAIGTVVQLTAAGELKRGGRSQ